MYAIDVETDSLDYTTCRLLGLGFYSPTEKGYLTDLGRIRDFLIKNRETSLVFHNGKYDVKVLYRTTGLKVEIGFDTHLAAALDPHKPKNRKLETCAIHYCNLPPWKEEGLIENLANEPVEVQAMYCIHDCEATYKVAVELFRMLDETKQVDFYMEQYLPVGNYLAWVEDTGFPIDKGWLLTKQAELIKEIGEGEKALYEKYYTEYISAYEKEEIAKYRKKSPNTKFTDEQIRKKVKYDFTPQKKIWLLEKMGISCKTNVKEDGKVRQKTTSARKFLEKVDSKLPIVGELLELQDKTTRESYIQQYLDAIRPDGRIHCNINQHVTDTGRLSASSPNLQNVTAENKPAFVPLPGDVLVAVDLDQIEPRMMAIMSQDRQLMEPFLTGIDLYGVTANYLLGLGIPKSQITKKFMKENFPKERDFGKVTTLAIAYGKRPGNLAAEITAATGMECSYAQAYGYIEKYWRLYPGLSSLKHWAYHSAYNDGYITNLFGRKIYLKLTQNDCVPLNYLAQSTASDFNTLVQLDLKEIATVPYSTLMLVHDEVVFSVRENDVDEFIQSVKTVIKDGLKHWAPRVKTSIELSCEYFIGSSWACKG